MLFSHLRSHISTGKKSVASTPASPTLKKIAEYASALRLPPHSLYYAYGQERAADLRARTDVVDAALQQVQREAGEAGVRLMSLDAPERTFFSSYKELIKADNDGC